MSDMIHIYFDVEKIAAERWNAYLNTDIVHIYASENVIRCVRRINKFEDHSSQL